MATKTKYLFLQRYQVGQPFPGPVPQQDGARLHMAESGDVSMIVQCRKPNIAEYLSLDAGFSSYSYFEAAGPVTLGSWVFKFPAPLSYFDAVFHAGLYPDDRAERFLEMEWNALLVFILDGQTIRFIRTCGLRFDAVDLFKDTIRRQLKENVTRASYDSAVERLFRMNPKQIYSYGKIFKHGERQD